MSLAHHTPKNNVTTFLGGNKWNINEETASWYYEPLSPLMQILQLLLDKPRECEWGKELHSYVAIISNGGKILFLLLDKPRERRRRRKSLIKRIYINLSPFLNFFMVWGVGFEPTKQYAQDFKPCSFDQTRITPLIIPNTCIYVKRLFLRDCQHPPPRFGYIMTA